MEFVGNLITLLVGIYLGGVLMDMFKTFLRGQKESDDMHLIKVLVWSVLLLGSLDAFLHGAVFMERMR